MSKTMIRIEKNSRNPYTMINNYLLHDPNLSWKAKGILAYLLSLPDDWQVYESELVKHASDGKDSLKSGVTELVEKNYVHRTRLRNEKGHLKGYKYSIHEIPTESGLSNLGKPNNGKPKNGLSNLGKPNNGKPKNGLSNLGKPATTNTNLTNTNLTNTNLTNTNLTNTNNTKEGLQEESSSGPQIDENLMLIAKEYEQCGFGTIDMRTKELLEDLLEQFSTEWIVQAFSICVESNKRTLKYARGILENWRREGGMKLGGREDGKGLRGINSKAEEEYGNIKGVTYL